MSPPKASSSKSRRAPGAAAAAAHADTPASAPSTSTAPSTPFVPTAPADIDSRRLVRVERERVAHVSSTDFPGHYPGEDHAWDLATFAEHLRVQPTRLSQRSIALDLVGVDASIANALRRTLLADVPTLAIEHVYVQNNTSIVQDEVLAHRLGLVPLNVDPALFEARSSTDIPTDQNTVVFTLRATCTRKPGPSDPNDPYASLENGLVPASALTWDPQGEQAEIPQLAARPPAPTNGAIVLAKLRPGQTIEVVCHAVKGTGKDHAKWSPVATASYRLLPHITLLKPIPPPLAPKFAACFSPGVVRIDAATGAAAIDPVGVRGESMSREVLRHPEFDGLVRLGRVRDWFLFHIESEGPYAPEALLPAAVRVLRGRIATLRAAVAALGEGADAASGAAAGAAGAGVRAAGAQDGDVVMAGAA